jgi:hypothetical protein
MCDKSYSKRELLFSIFQLLSILFPKYGNSGLEGILIAEF